MDNHTREFCQTKYERPFAEEDHENETESISHLSYLNHVCYGAHRLIIGKLGESLKGGAGQSELSLQSLYIYRSHTLQRTEGLRR